MVWEKVKYFGLTLVVRGMTLHILREGNHDTLFVKAKYIKLELQ
jgi:hypothetical protein